MDARLVSGEWGGVEQVVIGLAAALSRLDDGNEQYLFLVNQGHTAWLEPYISGPSSLLIEKPPAAAFEAQKGVRATGGHTQVFGRNEIGVQHLHRTINRLIDENYVEGYTKPAPFVTP